MKRKLLGMLLTVSMTATILAGCGGAAPAAAGAGGADSSSPETQTSDTAGASAEDAKEADTQDASADTGSSGSGDSTLTVWTWDPNFNIYSITEAEKIYQKENPDFKLEIVETPWEDMQTNLGTILGSGNLSQLPDILLMQDFAFQKYAIT